MQDMDKIIDELTLMLLYLTSWQECPTEEIRHKPIRTAEKLRLTWKGHDRSALSRLDAAGLVLNYRGENANTVEKLLYELAKTGRRVREICSGSMAFPVRTLPPPSWRNTDEQ